MLQGLIVLNVVFGIVILVFVCKYMVLQDKLVVCEWYKQKYFENMENITAELGVTQNKLKKEVGRNKSVEIRTGFIMEKIAPFTKAFGENPKNVKHLGDPIDYVCFEDDYVCFVEVKTGKSRLSPKQNKIKKLIEEGKVNFKTVRYDYE